MDLILTTQNTGPGLIWFYWTSQNSFSEPSDSVWLVTTVVQAQLCRFLEFVMAILSY